MMEAAVLVLYKDYRFTTKDIKKRVLLANQQTAKILTVIVESGQLHSIYGIDMHGDFITWSPSGKASIPEQDIVLIYEDKNG